LRASLNERAGIFAKGGETLEIQAIGQGLFIGSTSFLIFFAYVSFFEWALHKYVMHTLLWPYPFQAHALTHHGLFRADHSYHLQREQDKPKVTFAWWNAPGLFLLQTPLLLIANAIGGPIVLLCGSAALIANYVLYEYLHWCMHIPQQRWIEQTKAFQFLKAHHFLHHRYALRNLNVVLPLADWVMGTLITTDPKGLSAPASSLAQEQAQPAPILSELQS
jgi:hypothetical protein